MRKRYKMAGEYTVLGHLHRYHKLPSDRVNMATLRRMLILEYVIAKNGIIRMTPKGRERWAALDKTHNQKHLLIGGMMHDAKQQD